MDAHKFRGHTPEPRSRIRIVLFPIGVGFSVYPTCHPLHNPVVCHDLKPSTGQSSSHTWSLLSPEQEWSSARRNPLPKTKSSLAHPRPLGRGSQKNRQDLLCSALQEGIVLARDRPQQSFLKAEPSSEGEVEATAFRLCF